MKKSLLALAATTLFALSSASVFAAAHTGAAPMATPATGAAPMAMGDLSGSKADSKALNKKGDAEYKAAKKACKPMKGAEEKACMMDAKLVHEKNEAKAKGIHEMAEAKSDKDKAKVMTSTTRKWPKPTASTPRSKHHLRWIPPPGGIRIMSSIRRSNTSIRNGLAMSSIWSPSAPVPVISCA